MPDWTTLVRARLGPLPLDPARAADVVVALLATRFLESSLYTVSATDPATFAGVAAVLLLVALMAQVVPILRAIGVDPTVALRQD